MSNMWDFYEEDKLMAEALEPLLENLCDRCGHELNEKGQCLNPPCMAEIAALIEECRLDDIAYEQYKWECDYDAGLKLVFDALARFCPVCHNDIGEADFEDDYEEYGGYWLNECPEDGCFSWDPESGYEFEEVA